MIETIRNIGIFAHVDAGKTTLTEQILLSCGAIRSAGRVDDGTAHTDALAIERQRGISIRSGTACGQWAGHSIRIIDTPGHVDFSDEVETALLAVDGAVLVVSAVEGVQAQTAVIARVLAALGLPTLIFINKTDRAGADIARTMEQLSALVPRPILLSQDEEALIDKLSIVDDELLALAVEGRVTRDDLRLATARACRARAATPALFGSALRGEGVSAVLDGIAAYLPPPADAGEMSIAAYHVRREGEERQVRVRVFGGELRLGPVEGFGRVRRLREQTPTGEENVKVLKPGDIGVAVGLEGLRAGMWLGRQMRGRPHMAAPVLRAQVVPEKQAQLPALLRALERLADEQTALRPAFEPRSRRVHIQLMGEIHQQVVEQTLRDEFGVTANLMPPEVLYRETPLRAGRGELAMFFPPWNAKASFLVEPAARGAGVRFVNRVSTDLIYLKHIRDIEDTVYEALAEGLNGWPVTDLTVTLTDARCSWLTRDNAGSRFGPVVPLGLFDALKDAGTRLLEPVYRFEALADESVSGALLYELSLMRAECEPAAYDGGTVRITGLVPVGTSQRFASKVSELTRGRGTWRTRLEGFHPAPEGVGRTIERTTPDPTNPTLYMDYITGRSTQLQ